MLWLHYEQLQDDTAAAARRVFSFLYPTEPRPSGAKIDAAVRFAAFGPTAARGDDALRKGVVGDHAIYLSKEHWDAMAARCAKRRPGR